MSLDTKSEANLKTSNWDYKQMILSGFVIILDSLRERRARQRNDDPIDR